MLEMWLEMVHCNGLVTWREKMTGWVSACKNMAVPGNAGKGRPRKRWRDVLDDDMKKGRLDRGLATKRQMEGSNYLESV